MLLSSFITEFYNAYTNATPDTGNALHRLRKRGAGNHDTFFIVAAVLIPVLVLLSGVFAGLTLGYMSLDETQLNVLATSGTACVVILDLITQSLLLSR
jgi:metal transporter CNNM